MRPALLALCLVTAASLHAADREFNDIVRAISQEFHTRPTTIPFFGIVNVFAETLRPAGTHHIDLAVFEHLTDHDRDGRNLPEMIQAAVGHAWKPFVKVRSFKNGSEETVLVYMRQEGPKDWRLLVTAVERDEATVVQLRLNAEALAQWVKDPEHKALRWHGDITE
jgi:hypothetical protein